MSAHEWNTAIYQPEDRADSECFVSSYGYDSSTPSRLSSLAPNPAVWPSLHSYLLPVRSPPDVSTSNAFSQFSPNSSPRDNGSSHADWKSALRRFSEGTPIQALVYAAYCKWYSGEAAKLETTMSQYAQTSPEYARCLHHYHDWQSQTNDAIADARIDKIAALRMSLKQYVGSVDDQHRIICAFYEWFVVSNTDARDKEARNYLLTMLNKDPHTLNDMQIILEFHSWYSSNAFQADEHDYDVKRGGQRRSQSTEEHSPFSGNEEDTQRRHNPHKSYPCPVAECKTAPKRRADLKRHISCVHEKTVEALISCTEPNCNKVGPKGFTRKDHYIDHLRRAHNKEAEHPKKGKTKDRMN